MRLRMLKAQAAVEYLTTYGWAIVVVFLVLAVLVGYGVLSTRANEPDSCEFAGNSVVCSTIFVANTPGAGGNLALRTLELTSQIQRNVYVCAVQCSAEASPSLQQVQQCSNAAGSAKLTLKPGERVVVVREWMLQADSGGRGGVDCLSVNGEKAGVQVGSKFFGRIYLRYSLDGDKAGAEARSLVADLSQTVQRGG